jgi:hypothetical protein
VAADICFSVARELLKLEGSGTAEAGSAVELAVRGLGVAEGLEGEGAERMGAWDFDGLMR